MGTIVKKVDSFHLLCESNLGYKVPNILSCNIYIGACNLRPVDRRSNNYFAIAWPLTKTILTILFHFNLEKCDKENFLEKRNGLKLQTQ